LKIFEEMDDFSKDNLNKECSKYLFNQNERGQATMRNEEVFSLLRFVITGNPVGPPVGDIMEVLG
jgi:hypothetical protein